MLKKSSVMYPKRFTTGDTEMFKRKLLCAACLSAGLGFGAASASALPYLQPNSGNPLADNYVQLLEDGFYEVLIRKEEDGYSLVAVTPNTVIQVGDLFAGVQRIQATELASPEGGPFPDPISLQGGDTFTYIFLIETATSVEGTPGFGDGANDVQTFKPADSADWEAIFGAGGLLDISSEFDITDLDQDSTNNPPKTQVNADTMAMLFWGVDYPLSTSTGTLPVSASSFVAGGELQYEFGCDADRSGLCTGDQFWRTSGSDSAYPFFSASTSPQVKIALDITQQWAGPNLEKHIYRQTLGDIAFTGPTHLQGQGSVAGTAQGTNWGVFGDIDTYIRPVPAPTPLALIALGLLGLGASQRRKKSA